jgi:hypothetical protein
MITEHKTQTNGAAWPVKSSGNLIRNNISAAAVSLTATGGVKDHNLTTTAYSGLFVDYTNFDFSLLPGASAVNAGEDAAAPLLDIRGRTRSSPVDLGAYEYGALPATNLTYASWRADWFLHDPEAAAPGAMPFSDGVPNLLKYLFGISPLFPLGGQDLANLPQVRMENLAGTRYLGWKVRRSASAPDVQWDVEACSDLATGDWRAASPAGVQMLSRDPVTADESMLLRFNASTNVREFFRLKAQLPPP